MAPFFDLTPILGGKACIYRRVGGGAFLWRYEARAEGRRVVQSLKTKDLGAAIQIATEKTLDAMSKERSGVRVVSGTIGDAIDAYEAQQKARLERGEIRNWGKQKQNVADLRNNRQAVWGLDAPLSSMTQARWEEYIGTRPDIKLSTLKSHLMAFRSLVHNHGLVLGGPKGPDFDHIQEPRSWLIAGAGSTTHSGRTRPTRG